MHSMTPVLRWSMRLALLLSAAVFVVFTWETVRGTEGWPRRRALTEEVQNVSRDINSLDDQVRALRRQIVAERERPEVQELLVRDFLGYVRSNDVVLRGPDP